MTLDKILSEAANQAPLFFVVIIVVWLSLPQLAERFDTIAKLAAPLLKKQRKKQEDREKERREAALEQARRDVRMVLQELTPPDQKRVNELIDELGKQLDRVQDGENMLRAFVIYDELWHFHDDINEARQGRKPAKRFSFDTFESKWKQGWRPFDDDGRLVDDGTGPNGYE